MHFSFSAFIVGKVVDAKCRITQMQNLRVMNLSIIPALLVAYFQALFFASGVGGGRYFWEEEEAHKGHRRGGNGAELVAPLPDRL